MKIQFNTDHNIEGGNRVSDYFSKFIKEELHRFQTQITRIEVHLSDEDSHKNGQDDKKCMLEARLKNLQPIAVINMGNTNEEAIKGAVRKLKTSLDTISGRLNKH
ncbi:MAG: ribosomal subunit interface protein [Bacteroidetes bacterium RIFCSPLOWO2_12_FULL_31_6]|nr:MAG: ribosomal subunit interface protein [Bacteroidetes bacterium RIFCSPLOWO2_12_FULL_31_6]